VLRQLRSTHVAPSAAVQLRSTLLLCLDLSVQASNPGPNAPRCAAASGWHGHAQPPAGTGRLIGAASESVRVCALRDLASLFAGLEGCVSAVGYSDTS